MRGAVAGSLRSPSSIMDSDVEQCANQDTRRSTHPDMAMIDGEDGDGGEDGEGRGHDRRGELGGGWGGREAEEREQALGVEEVVEARDPAV